MGITSTTGPYNAAAEVYGVDDTVMLKIPRLQYQFKMSMFINQSVTLFDEKFGRTMSFERVQSITLPDYNYSLSQTNQYNRLRHHPTRIEVNPVNVVFYDTKDNQWQHLLQAYNEHYYHGNRLGDPITSAYDTVRNSFVSGRFGAKLIPDSQRFFIERIAIESRDTAQSGRVIILYNCMIRSVNHSIVSYDSSQPITWTVTFQPEHVNMASASTSATGSVTINPTSVGF